MKEHQAREYIFEKKRSTDFHRDYICRILFLCATGILYLFKPTFLSAAFCRLLCEAWVFLSEMGEKPKRRENILETSNCNNGVFSDCFRIDYCLRELFPEFRHRNDYAEKGYTSAFDCFCNFYDVSSCNHRRIFLP